MIPGTDGGNGRDSGLRGDAIVADDDTAADFLVGGVDTLHGEQGNDVLQGDFMNGGKGADRLRAGSDGLTGGRGRDRLYGDWAVGGLAFDKVTLGGDLMDGGDDDVLRGDAVSAEQVFGGNDALFRGAGRDTLRCEFGIDGFQCGTEYDVADGGPDVDSADAACEAQSNM